MRKSTNIIIFTTIAVMMNSASSSKILMQDSGSTPNAFLAWNKNDIITDKRVRAVALQRGVSLKFIMKLSGDLISYELIPNKKGYFVVEELLRDEAMKFCLDYDGETTNFPAHPKVSSFSWRQFLEIDILSDLTRNKTNSLKKSLSEVIKKASGYEPISLKILDRGTIHKSDALDVFILLDDIEHCKTKTMRIQILNDKVVSNFYWNGSLP